MRILHIAESAKGGVGTYLAEILPDQAQRYGSDNVRALVPRQHAAHISGVDRRQFLTFRRAGRSARGVMELARAIRSAITDFRPTIVHAHSSLAGGVLRLLYGWKRPPFAIVYCPHGWAFDRSSSALKKRLIERIERSLAGGTDRIVLISAHEQREAQRIGIPDAKLALVLNGIGDVPPVPPARWDDQRVKVLFIGRLDVQKGYDVLLDAFEPIKHSVALRVIGKAVASSDTRTRARGRDVEYLGWRSLGEIATEIAAADVLVMPSRWEGFGLVALEAMRGRCAVVASAVGGLSEIVVDGETGYLVPPDNPARLMDVLARHDRATWRAMGAAGRARYEAYFTAQRMNAELASLYRSLDAHSPAETAQGGTAVHA